MKHVYIFLLFILLASCENFNVKKTSSTDILNEELKTFKWNEVDAYPTFSSCDSLTSKLERKQCFERVLTTHISTYLLNERIVVGQDIKDTIVLQFQISETGDLVLVNTKIDSLTKKEISNIDVLLQQSLKSIPEIFPAIKRGQQVKTEFTLPIIVDVN